MREDQVIKWAARLLALLMLGLAYLLLPGDSTGGGIAGALAIGVLAYQFFPFIQRLEAFGLKAELREKIHEADHALNSLRGVAATLATANALQAAWSGRWGRPPRETIDNSIEEIDRILAGLGVPLEKRLEIKRPYLMITGSDLFHVFSAVTQKLLLRYLRAANDKQTAYVTSIGGTSRTSGLSLLLDARRQTYGTNARPCIGRNHRLSPLRRALYRMAII